MKLLVSFVMACKRKTRRGRKRNRLSSSKRKLFVPEVHPSSFKPDVRRWKKSLRSHSKRRSDLSDPTESQLKEISINLALEENIGTCEFSYSHWWNKTPVKKGQKLIRPPYTPIAPNNSTQYLIDDRVRLHPKDLLKEKFDLCGEPNRCGLNLNDSFVINSLGRNDEIERLHLLDEQSPIQESDSECDGANDHILSPISPLREVIYPCDESDQDSDYESPDDLDFYSFVQNDFLETYENVKKESLLRLSKDDLIKKLIGLERKFDSLQERS